MLQVQQVTALLLNNSTGIFGAHSTGSELDQCEFRSCHLNASSSLPVMLCPNFSIVLSFFQEEKGCQESQLWEHVQMLVLWQLV